MEPSLFNISLQLDYPWLLLCVLPVLAVIFWQLRGRKPGFSIRDSGLEYLAGSGIRTAEHLYRYRIALIVLVTVLLGLAWGAPQIRTSHTFMFGPSRELHPAYLIALDVSGSMTEPLGGYVINGQINNGGVTRFEASRDKLYDFIDRHKTARLGLVLFSVQPMLVRWPTLQTGFGFRDVLDEGMRFTNPDRTRPSQLARFAGGTATRDGLVLSRDVLMKQKAAGKSLILIGDLIDNADEIIEGIQDLYGEDIFTYVVAIDPDPQNLEAMKLALKGKPGVHIYSVKSAAELTAAFESVDTVESERQAAAGNRNYLQDLRWFFAFSGFAVALLLVVLFETRLHKTQI